MLSFHEHQIYVNCNFGEPKVEHSRSEQNTMNMGTRHMVVLFSAWEKDTSRLLYYIYNKQK